MKRSSFLMMAALGAFAFMTSTSQAQIRRISQDEALQSNIQLADEVDIDIEEPVDKAIQPGEVEMPQPEQQNITIDYLAPLGGEVMLLACLGGAYLLGKRKKEE